MLTCGRIYNSSGHRCGRRYGHPGPCRVEDPRLLLSLGSGNVFRVSRDRESARRVGFFRSDGSFTSRRGDPVIPGIFVEGAEASPAFVSASSLREARIIFRNHCTLRGA